MSSVGFSRSNPKLKHNTINGLLGISVVHKHLHRGPPLAGSNTTRTWRTRPDVTGPLNLQSQQSPGLTTPRPELGCKQLTFFTCLDCVDLKSRPVTVVHIDIACYNAGWPICGCTQFFSLQLVRTPEVIFCLHFH